MCCAIVWSFCFSIWAKDQFQWLTISKTSATRYSQSRVRMNRTPCAIYFCTKPVTAYMELVFIKTMISNSPMSIRTHIMAEHSNQLAFARFTKTPYTETKTFTRFAVKFVAINVKSVSFSLCNHLSTRLMNKRAANLANWTNVRAFKCLSNFGMRSGSTRTIA